MAEWTKFANYGNTEKGSRKNWLSNIQVVDSTCLFAKTCAELAEEELVTFNFASWHLREMKLSGKFEPWPAGNSWCQLYSCLLLLGLLASKIGALMYRVASMLPATLFLEVPLNHPRVIPGSTPASTRKHWTNVRHRACSPAHSTVVSPEKNGGFMQLAQCVFWSRTWAEVVLGCPSNTWRRQLGNWMNLHMTSWHHMTISMCTLDGFSIEISEAGPQNWRDYCWKKTLSIQATH